MLRSAVTGEQNKHQEYFHKSFPRYSGAETAILLMILIP
jgi:hypothetical protein